MYETNKIGEMRNLAYTENSVKEKYLAYTEN